MGEGEKITVRTCEDQIDEAMYILTFLEAAEHAAGGNLWIENL